MKAREMEDFKRIREIKGSRGIAGTGRMNGITMFMRPLVFLDDTEVSFLFAESHG